MKKYGWLLWLLIAPLSWAEEALLSAEKAFSFQSNEQNGQVELNWTIAPGYYLYQDKIKLSTPEGVVNEVAFPEALIKNDEFFGKVATYRNRLSLSVPVKSAQLKLTYQGCADLGVCYPPISKTIALKANLPKKSRSLTQVLNAFSVSNGKPPRNTPLADNPLRPDEAFQLSVTRNDNNTLSAIWRIKPNYYLYHNKFNINAQDATLGLISVSKGKLKEDDIFGKVEVHKQYLEIIIPIQSVENVPAKFTIGYQGCWEGGVCYPPQVKTFEFSLPVVVAQSKSPASARQNQAPASAPTLNETDQITALLQQDNILWVLLSFFGFGLLLSLTPCVFPMIPILSGIIVGQKEITTRKAVMMSVVFVLAMSVTYAIAGVLAGHFGENLQILFQTPWILVVFSLIFVALAFSMFGYYDIQLPAALQRKITAISNRQEGGHLIGVAIMGFLSALIVGPCVAPPLAGALIYIGQTGDALLGALSLFVMSLGMGAPLLAVGAGVSKLPKAGGWMEHIKAIFGILMLAVAIYLSSRIMTEVSVLILWALLFSISPIAMGVLSKVNTTWQRIFQAIGLIILGYGILLWGLVARGGGDMFEPLAYAGNAQTSSVSTQNTKIDFKRIESLGELTEILNQAKQNQQTVMLDFYADWCISCKELERFVFSNAQVLSNMQGVIALKADVTQNNAQDKALMAHFNVIGPPAILFFTQGKENRTQRIVGEIGAQDFINRLKSL
jgi:thiol:disulfide interchange protein DsbD